MANHFRLPAVAGLFYPQDKAALIKLISTYLNLAQKEVTQILEQQSLNKKQLKILIVPHAGLQYSGQVAAYAYAVIDPQSINRVILLGSSHQSFIHGAALADHQAWQTVLGQVELDLGKIDDLTKKSALFYIDNAVHQDEHSLEVQLPFLQVLLQNKPGENQKSWQIIPILIGESSEKEKQTMAQNLNEIIDEQTLVIVSSDLSHYPSCDQAVKVDQETIEAILNLDPPQFSQVHQKIADIPNLATRACGAEAILVALELAKLQKIKQAVLLKYANSGDISGDHQRVVGYSAIACY